MKVLLVTQTINPRSGLGRYSKGVCDGLRDQGISVSVMSSDGDVLMHVEKNWFNFIRNCLTARRVVKNFDIIHALDAWPYGIYALCAVIGTRKKLFVGGVGTYSVPPLAPSIKRSLLLVLYRRVEAVFCISEYTKKRIQKRLPFKAPLHVVHLAVDQLPAPRDTRTQFAVPKNASPIFITVGEVKERKGQLDTLIGVSKLKSRYQNFLYLIVGSSSDTEYIANIRSFAQELGILENVIFIDTAKTDADLAGLYSIADIHLLNSNNQGDHFEGFGLVFLEANQFGVPGIGSRNCGIEDAINDGVSGLLVPQKDHNAIAGAIETILISKEKFARGARDWYTRFSWIKTVEIYSKFYTQEL